jgi:hypothetical protein
MLHPVITVEAAVAVAIMAVLSSSSWWMVALLWVGGGCGG